MSEISSDVTAEMSLNGKTIMITHVYNTRSGFYVMNFYLKEIVAHGATN